MKKTLRIAAAAAFASTLVVCAYAGGQSRRPTGDDKKPVAASARRAPAAKPAPAARRARGAKQTPAPKRAPAPAVKFTAIKSAAKSGKPAKRGPSANVAQPVNLLGAGFEDNVTVEFVTFANSTFTVQPQKVQGKKVTVAVPDIAVTGPVRLVTPDKGKSDPLTLQVVPVITTLSPATASPGTRLLIDGSGFARDAKVAFTGVKEPVAPTVVSPSRIDVVVPPGTKSGAKTTVTVVTAGGKSKPAKLTVP